MSYSTSSGGDYAIPINSGSYNTNNQLKAGGIAAGRNGTTTRGKSKGVKYIIKVL